MIERLIDIRTLSVGELNLSRIVLGTTYYGTDIPDELSFELMDEYYRLGGRTIDTGRAYGQSEDGGESKSERIIGKWIKERGLRGEITLITKGCHPKIEDMVTSRVNPVELRRDFYDSIDCLGVDNVDLYFVHRDDESQPVGPLMDTLDEFVKSGKTKALGASNWRLDRILEANAYAEGTGKTPFSISQLQWSVASCTNMSWGDASLVFMDDGLRTRFIEEKLPVMAFSSQAKGLFSKYLADPKAAVTKRAQRFFSPENLRKAEVIRKICEETGASPAAIAVAYITSHTLPAVALVGCTSLSQLADTMSARDLQLDAKTIKLLEDA